jgi:ATP-dependent Clp protease protease subunit
MRASNSMKQNLLDDNFDGDGWFDVVSQRLLDNSIHFLIGEIEEGNINRAMQWIVYENLNASEDRVLTLYINSTGGNLTDAFGLIDLMKTSVMPIRTIGIGSVMSAAFLIFSSGDKGHRYIAKNTSCMCHQYSAEIQGKFHDIKSEMIEAEYTNQSMLNLLVENTQLTEREVKKKLLPATDIWLQPQELIELNVADRIFATR